MKTTNLTLSNIVLKDLYAVNVVMLNNKNTHQRIDRPCYAFSLKIEGETVYTCKGKKYLSNIGNLVLLSKGANYSFSCTEAGECIIVEFDADFIGLEFDIISIPLSKTSQQELQKHFVNISNTWKAKKDNYMLKCKSLFYEILSEINLEENTSYTPTYLKKTIEPAINYINLHFEDINISIDSLAALCDVSSIYFRKLFGKIYNTSPIKYLIKIRINKAKEFLRGDYLSISEIARLTGFSSVYTFSKTFKKETGITPSEYKNLKIS